MKYIVIITSIVQDKVASNAVLFNSFQEALEYARKQAANQKHLANEYTEKIGTSKLHAKITLRGKYVNMTYTISNLAYVDDMNVLDTHLNTYKNMDFLPDGKCI